MYASARVEGKVLEVFGGDGGLFPFKVSEASRRKRSFIRLSSQEFRWLAVQMVRFCFSKGEPLWFKSLRWGQRCLLLQLRKNTKGRFIVLSLLGNGGQVRSVIFPEGAKAEGWFRVTKILKKMLIEGHKKPHPPPRKGMFPSREPASRDRSFANVVRGHPGGSSNSPLKGWKCRNCGSWDVCAAVIGEDHNLSKDALKQKVSFKDNAMDVMMPYKKDVAKELLVAPTPCANQFKVLRDMWENDLSPERECNSHDSSPCATPCASRIPESPLKVVEEELHPTECSPSTSVLVYARRKKSRKAILVASEAGSPTVQEKGGPLSFEEALPQAHPQELDGAALPGSSDSGNATEGAAWVLERMVFFCKKMGLAIEGRETKLPSFLASLEANRLRREQSVEASMGDEGGRVRLFSDGASH